MTDGVCFVGGARDGRRLPLLVCGEPGRDVPESVVQAQTSVAASLEGSGTLKPGVTPHPRTQSGVTPIVAAHLFSMNKQT